MVDQKKSHFATELLFLVALTLPQHALAKATNPTIAEYSVASQAEPDASPRAASPNAAKGAVYAQTDYNNGQDVPRDTPPRRNNPRVEEDGKKTDAARAKLKEELARIRAHGGETEHSLPPQLPVKRKPESRTTATVNSDAVHPPVQQSANPEIEHAVSRLLLLQFGGTQASDSGVKAIHTLLQSGLVAGTVFNAENVVSKAQLKELMKFLWAGGRQGRPVFAIREIGGNSPSFPADKGFEPWPSQQAVSSQGDPQYAYSVYQTLASNLSREGFNMNFGPSIVPPQGEHQPVDSFGRDPLQVGVFAKTFVLGHRDAGVIPVPIVDGSDVSIRALKTLLVSYPETPIAGTPLNSQRDLVSLLKNSTMIRGARFCFVVPKLGAEGENAAESLGDGCDVLILTAEGDQPTTVRQRAVQAIASAVAKGELSLQQLALSSQKLEALRAAIMAHPEDASVQTEIHAEKHNLDNF